MPQETSHPIPEEIYYAAEQYLPLLSEPLQSQIRALLAEARAGEKRDNAILLQISEDRAAHQWLRSALLGEPVSGETVMRGYEPLPGGGPAVPANSLWRCPRCGFEWRVLHAGRPVPPCPRDGTALERVDSPSKEGV